MIKKTIITIILLFLLATIANADRILLDDNVHSPFDVDVGDMDNDGLTDILVAGDSSFLITYANLGNAEFIRFNQTHTRGDTYAAQIIHVDNDSYAEIVSATHDSQGLDGYDATRRYPIIFWGDFALRCVEARDINQDNYDDIITGNYDMYGDVTLLLNNQSYGFNPTVVDQNNDYILDVNTTDLNNDGHIDILAVANPVLSGAGLRWYENDGTESFTTHTIDTLSAGGSSVSTGDLNNDGHIDIVATYTDGSHGLYWYENDGSESFTRHSIKKRGLHDSTIYDVNNDGYNDIISVFYGIGKVIYFKNNGNETFQEIVIDDNLNGPRALTIGYLNDNTLPDLVVADTNSQSVYLYTDFFINYVDFNYTIKGNTVYFYDTSNYGSYYFWNFDDNNYISNRYNESKNPVHTYKINWSALNESITHINYTVNLEVCTNDLSYCDNTSKTITINRPTTTQQEELQINIPTELLIIFFGILILLVIIHKFLDQVKGVLNKK